MPTYPGVRSYSPEEQALAYAGSNSVGLAFKGLSTLDSFVTFCGVIIPRCNTANCNAHVHTGVFVTLRLEELHCYKPFICTPP